MTYSVLDFYEILLKEKILILFYFIVFYYVVLNFCEIGGLKKWIRKTKNSVHQMFQRKMCINQFTGQLYWPMALPLLLFTFYYHLQPKIFFNIYRI